MKKIEGSPLRILIVNCSNTYNYGSMMMGENFVKYFDEVSGFDNSYYFDTDDIKNIDRLKIATQKDNIFPYRFETLFKTLNRKKLFISYMGLVNNISKEARQFHAIIVLGGDDFTEDYGWRGPVGILLRLTSLVKAGIPVFLVGQTIGPYRSFRKKLIPFLLRKQTKVFCREAVSYDYLKKIGVKNIEIMDDLAILPLQLEDSASESPKRYITYCPSLLIYKYSLNSSLDAWIEFNLRAIRHLMKTFPNHQIVLLSHVLRPEEVDDRIMTKSIVESLTESELKRTLLIDNPIIPAEARDYIKKSYLTVSSRMHPLVSAISTSTPIIGISYSQKYYGIIGERYGLQNYLLDITKLNYEEMYYRFSKLCEELTETKNSIAISNQMNKVNTQAQQTITSALHEILFLIKENIGE